MGDLVSVITAVHAPGAGYLRECYESLAAQQLPAGWGWEWIVQEDGRSGALPDVLPDDARISLGAGRSAGPAITRNLALARARGTLVKVLDADDLLIPGALARDIEALTGNPLIGWTTCKALDLMPDGSTSASELDALAPGVIPLGSLLPAWESHNHVPPVHPATLCVRRPLLLALGGWMALPASEDTGLLLAANALTEGCFLEKPGLLYRKWPGQSTSSAAHSDPAERTARIALIAARARALLELTALDVARSGM